MRMIKLFSGGTVVLYIIILICLGSRLPELVADIHDNHQMCLGEVLVSSVDCVGTVELRSFPYQ
jgi:hypothetical protein